MIIDLNNIIIFLYAIIGATVGALATYFGTIKLQKRAWQREDIKDVYAPLRTEFELNKKKCQILDKLENKIWNKINENHLVWLIPEKLRVIIKIFYEEDITKFNEDRKNAVNKVTNLIKEFLESRKKEKEKGKTKEETHELDKIFNLNVQHILDHSWGITIQILHNKFENSSFIQGKFKNIKRVLNLDFKSLEEFFDRFSNEFKRTKEYETLLKNKKYVLKEIDKLLKHINQKIGVE